MSYFENYRNALNSGIGDTPEGLRNCQIGAYWAIKSHFTTHDSTPATVSIPTGGGKTALMMLLSFALDGDCVLIISPSEVVRSQTKEKFKKLEGLQKAGIVDPEMETPSVYALDERVTSESKWDELRDYDVIVALPHNISPVYNTEGRDDIVPPSSGYFDIAFFDEAHHARAPSWRELIYRLEDSKRVLLTATPFRRDRQTLPGELVYHYPLAQAMDDEIYEQIEYSRFIPSEASNRDEELCTETEDELEELNTQYQNEGSDHSRKIQTLIRTNTISKAEDLKELYNENTDLDIEPIHSDQTDQENQDVITQLKPDEIAKSDEFEDSDLLDGVIAVGKLGEGFDVDTLKLAVFHDPPKSFPFTLQLIGRVTRPLDDASVSATVIADPDQMQRQGIADTVQQLYREDKAWSQLIPDIVSEFVDLHAPTTDSQRILTGVRKDDLKPYLSTQLYRVNQSQFNPDQQFEFSFVQGLYRIDSDDDSYVGWISEQLDQPSWATNTSLIQTKFDLHLYYRHSSSNTLFEYTSADRIAARIRDEILADDVGKLGGKELVSLIQDDELSEFLTAGLRSGQGSAGTMPNYKMYLGDRVEGSVDSTDKETFRYGHALARLDDSAGGDETTRGVGVEQGSVWSSGRVYLDEFVQWCRRIARQLTPDDYGNRVQKLGLRYPTKIEEFTQEPYHVGVDPELYRYQVMVLDDREPATRVDSSEYEDWTELEQPMFEIDQFDNENSHKVNLVFYPTTHSDPIHCTYDVKADEWDGELTEFSFKVEKKATGTAEFSGERILHRHPPQFFLGNGELVQSGQSFEIAIGSEELPDSCFDQSDDIDWSDCDRTVEYRNKKEPEDGMQTVHEWTESYLQNQGDRSRILFKDHGSGEIADYVYIDSDREVISLYHCKSGKTNDDSELVTGASLGHVKDVIDQVLRSRIWIKSFDILDQIAGRNSRDINPHFIEGEDEFEELRENFEPTVWEYEVVAVLPALDAVEAQQTDRVNTVLVTCYEWLQQVDSNLRIIGHQSE